MTATTSPAGRASPASSSRMRRRTGSPRTSKASIAGEYFHPALYTSSLMHSRPARAQPGQQAPAPPAHTMAALLVEPLARQHVGAHVLEAGAGHRTLDHRPPSAGHGQDRVRGRAEAAASASWAASA